MKLLKLTALCFSMTLLFAGCDKEKNNTFSNSIILNGAQETPPVTTTATGTMDFSYNKDTRLFSFTIDWTGLSGPVAQMHIHGPAGPGFAAGPIQNLITPSNGIATPSASRYPATGTFSATTYVDGRIITESDLLNGKLYINIHTATNPAGEIRGQIVF